MSRALVTVVRSHGDAMISDAIVRGVVSREMRMIQAQRDLMRCRQRDDVAAKIALANELYAIEPESQMRRAFESAMGLLVVLAQWRRENRNACRQV